MPASRDVQLLDRRSLPGGYAVLTFRHPEVATRGRAGQFVMMKAGACLDLPLKRPFSILGTNPERESFDVFIKAVGPGSRALTELSGEATASCLGPLGRAFEAPAPGTAAWLVAGGFGIAPLLFFARELMARGQTATIFFGGRTAADLAIRETFSDLSGPVVLATEDGSLGERGTIVPPLEARLDSAERPVALYSCGPGGLLRAVARVAEERGLPAQVSLDPWMGCGIGTCLGCVVRVQDAGEERGKYRCACTEGPVFDAARVQWPGEEASRARRAATGAGA
jgi:dihydroorotate dehydrogenase electron transfer subunit